MGRISNLLTEAIAPDNFMKGKFVKKLIQDFKKGKYKNVFDKIKGSDSEKIVTRLKSEVTNYWDSAIPEIKTEADKEAVLNYLKTSKAKSAVENILKD